MEHEYSSSSGGSSASVLSKHWTAQDPTTAQFYPGGAAKWVFVAAYLLRPSTTNGAVRYVGGDTGLGTSSGTTDSVTLDTTPESGDAIFAGHMNDAKQVSYTSWDHGSFSLTEDYELDAGSGGPSNYSTGAFASGITTQTGTDVSCDHDNDGNYWSMIAGIFREFVKPELTGFRFRAISGSETSSKWYKATNEDIDFGEDDSGEFRLRLLIAGGDTLPSTTDWRVTCSYNGGQRFRVGPYTDYVSESSGPISATTTQQIGSGTFTSGKLVSSRSTIENVGLESGKETELEWTLGIEPDDVVTTDTLDFNVEVVDSVLGNYPLVPTEIGRITVNPVSLDQKAFRFRNDDDDEVDASWRQLVNVDDEFDTGTDDQIRVRFAIESKGGAAGYVLQDQSYIFESKNGGTWVGVGTTGDWAGASSSWIPTNVPTTQQISSPDVFYDIGTALDNVAFGAALTLSDTDYPTAEYEFTIKPQNTLSVDDYYDFAIRRGSAGGLLEIYTETPRLTILASQPITVNKAAETESVKPVVIKLPIKLSVGTASETEAAVVMPVGASTTVTVGTASEAEQTQPVVSTAVTVSVGTASEAEQAQPVVSTTVVVVVDKIGIGRLHFDGTSWLETDGDGLLNATDDLEIHALVKVMTLPPLGLGIQESIVHKYDSGGYYMSIRDSYSGSWFMFGHGSYNAPSDDDAINLGEPVWLRVDTFGDPESFSFFRSTDPPDETPSWTAWGDGSTSQEIWGVSANLFIGRPNSGYLPAFLQDTYVYAIWIYIDGNLEAHPDFRNKDQGDWSTVDVTDVTDDVGTTWFTTSKPTWVDDEHERVLSVKAHVTVPVEAASETETAVAVDMSQTSGATAADTATETEAVQIVTPVATVSVSVAAVSETETPSTVTVFQAANVTVVATSETETAVAVSPIAGPVSVSVTAASETEAAYSLHGHRSIIATSESELAKPVDSIQEQFVTVTTASETVTAQGVSVTTVVSVGVAVAVEIEGAQNVQANVEISVGSVSEAETAQSVDYTSTVTVSAVTVAESETVQSVVIAGVVDVGVQTTSEAESVTVVIGRVAQTVSIAVPFELETTRAVTMDTDTVIAVGAAEESESAATLSLALGVQTAAESDTAMSIFGHRWVIWAPETEAVQPVAVVQQQFAAVTVASEFSSSQPVKIDRTVAVVTSSEVEAANSLNADVTVQVNVVSEAEAGQIVSSLTSTAIQVSVSSETESVKIASNGLSVVVVPEVEAAATVSVVQQQFVAVVAATETEAVRGIFDSRSVLTATESETVTEVTVGRVFPVVAASEADTPRAVSILQQQIVVVGISAEAEAVTTVSPHTGVIVQVATAIETEAVRGAHPVRLLLPGQEVEAAQPVAVASTVSTQVSTTSETEAAQPVVTEVATVIVGAAETESTQAVAVASPVTILVATAAETEAAIVVSTLTGTAVAVSVASETEAVQSIAIDVTVPISFASEIEAARALFGHRSILATVETEWVSEVSVIQEQILTTGTVTETEVSRLASIGLTANTAAETEASQDVQVNVKIAVGLAAVTDSAVSVTATAKTDVPVGTSSIFEYAGQVLADQAGAPQSIGTAASSETETTQTVDSYQSQTAIVQTAGEVEAVQAVVPVNVAVVALATEADTAEPVTVTTVVTIPVGIASEGEAAARALTGRVVLVTSSGETETTYAAPVLAERFVVTAVAGEVESVVSIGFVLQLPGVVEVEAATIVSGYITENFPYRNRVQSRENRTDATSRENKTSTSTSVRGVGS